jgi:hypothetical protein
MEIETRMLDEKWYVRGSRLTELEQAEKDLVCARALIERQRALIAALQEEKSTLRTFQTNVFSNCYHSISVAGNAHKKYAIKLVAHRLGIDFK